MSSIKENKSFTNCIYSANGNYSCDISKINSNEHFAPQYEETNAVARERIRKENNPCEIKKTQCEKSIDRSIKGEVLMERVKRIDKHNKQCENERKQCAEKK